MPKPTHLLWDDLETTGLHPHKGDVILEVALKLTDLQLNPLWEYQKVLHFSNSDAAALSKRNPFVYQMHTENGLLDECAESDVTLEQVEVEVCRFLDKELPDMGLDASTVIMAGSSIHFDREWTGWYWPEIIDRLHYRIMDVSSLYPVFDMLGWETPNHPKVHRAMKDVERSILELKGMLDRIRGG